MKKRNNPLALTTSVLAFFLVLAGCSKSNIKDTQEPVKTSETVEISSNNEENAQPTEVVKGKTGELFVRKSAVYVPETATLKYEKGSATTDMTTDVDYASFVGLNDAIFNVCANKGEARDNPSLNTAGEIRLFCKKETGNGGYIDVSVEQGYQIASIEIDFKSDGSDGYILVDDEIVGEGDGTYIIDSNAFRIRNVYQSDGSTKTVTIYSVIISYEEAAKDVAKGLSSQASLSYNYAKIADSASDTIDRELTESTTANSYKDWSGKEGLSGVVYSGNSAGGNTSIQLRTTNSNSGIVVATNNTNNYAKEITVAWNNNTNSGRSIDIYGKNTAYSAASDLYGESCGTKIGSLTYDGTNLENTISVGHYKYIGIRSHSDALYLSSISIQWDEYAFSDLAVRFGGLIKQTLWARLDSESDIQGYGVMLSTATYLDEDTIEGKYDTAKTDHTIDEAITTICEGNNIKNFYKELDMVLTNPAEAEPEQKVGLTGDYYIWNLYKEITTADIKTQFVAVAYIRTTSEMVFFNPTTTSAKGLAHDLVEGDAYDEDSFDGSLNIVAIWG